MFSRVAEHPKHIYIYSNIYLDLYLYLYFNLCLYLYLYSYIYRHSSIDVFAVCMVFLLRLFDVARLFIKTERGEKKRPRPRPRPRRRSRRHHLCLRRRLKVLTLSPGDGTLSAVQVKTLERGDINFQDDLTQRLGVGRKETSGASDLPPMTAARPPRNNVSKATSE